MKKCITRIKKDFNKSKTWVKENKIEFAVLISILVIGAFLRLFKISEYMTFLGDEGRDVIVVRRLLVDADLIFVGPGTSVGNMYLGPFYYYMMAPGLLLANFSPVGPAIQIAILGMATIFAVYYITRKWFGMYAALIASSLYALSPVIVYHSRFSWNPNIMPFFALITVYSLWKIWYEKKWSWILVTGLSFAIVLQSHYMGLVLLPLIALFWILSLTKALKNKKDRNDLIKYSIISVIAWIMVMSPLAVFDSKYNWRNFSAMRSFFFEKSGGVGISFNQILNKFLPNFELVVTRLIIATKENYAKLMTALLLFGSIWIVATWRKLNKLYKSAYTILLVWIIIGVIGLSIYNPTIYDHYYGYMFPALFILLGGLSKSLIDKGKVWGVLFTGLVYLLLFGVNVANHPFKYEPNRQLERTISIAEKISEDANGERYNLAVIASQNYEGAYRYFLEHWNTSIVIIDPQRADETIADVLYVVCEYEDVSQCQPVSNPKAEVANFGWSKIDEKWEVGGVVLFKLLHNYPEEENIDRIY